MSKSKLPDIFYREDGSIREYKYVYDDGNIISILTHTSYLSPNKVKVVWYSHNGKKILDEYDDIDVKSYMFEVIADGIPKELIKSVEFPMLSYSSNDNYLVKIIHEVLED